MRAPRVDPDPHAALVPALRARDPGALRTLVEEHVEPLFAFVFHRLDRDRAAAEDVVQETFLAAVEAAPRFRGDSTVFTWICGIARRLILQRRRRRRREPVPFSDLLLEPTRRSPRRSSASRRRSCPSTCWSGGVMICQPSRRPSTGLQARASPCDAGRASRNIPPWLRLACM